MKNIILLHGRKTGCGKSYLEYQLAESYPNEFKRVVSCTTRPPRHWELSGLDYYFVSKANFVALMIGGHIAQSYNLGDHYYGSLEAEFETGHENYLLALTPNSAMEFEKIISTYWTKRVGWEKINVIQVYFKISNEKIKENMRARGDSELEISKHLSDFSLEEEFKQSSLRPDCIITDEMLTPDLPSYFKEWLDEFQKSST